MGNVLVFAEHQHGKFPKTTLVAHRGRQGRGRARAAASATPSSSARASTRSPASWRQYGVKTVVRGRRRARSSTTSPTPTPRRSPSSSKQKGVEIVVATATAIGKDLLPRVAARLGAGMASRHHRHVDADGTFERPMYAGNVIATVEIEGRRAS